MRTDDAQKAWLLSINEEISPSTITAKDVKRPWRDFLTDNTLSDAFQYLAITLRDWGWAVDFGSQDLRQVAKVSDQVDVIAAGTHLLQVPAKLDLLMADITQRHRTTVRRKRGRNGEAR